MDYATLPPEINSARMYTGAGSAPMLAAAAAWDRLAAELRSAAASYSTVTSGLTTAWRGPSSATMAAAAAPYAAWLHTTADHAEQTANQARTAATAYETAFAATVPPPVIAANRATLASLSSTNVFGQNTVAIATTEAHYASMWAQDAAAMHGYAAASATASHVTPFSPPPHNTNPAGAAAQTTALTQAAATSTAANTQTTLSQLLSAVPQALHSLAAPVTSSATNPPSALATIDSLAGGPFAPGSLFIVPTTPQFVGVDSVGLVLEGSGFAATETDLMRIPASAGITAGVGRAGMVGGLSVPHGWASAAPAIKTAAATVPQSSPANATAPAALAATSQESPFARAALPSLAAWAMTGTGGAAARSAGMRGAAAEQPATATTAANVSNIFVIPEVAE
ncbi:PPE family protein [Mycobacterium sp.]|uniref:PPE family protein n=1 Tax=Mycobacterium sp. TaxID=1785 RepID=UPI0031D86ED9